MANPELRGNRPRSDAESDLRESEFRRIGLVLLCSIVALVAGSVGSNLDRLASWIDIASNLAVAVVGFVVAAALMRVMDMLALRRRNLDRVERSRKLSREALALLEERFPGVGDRARSIGAKAPIGKALEKEGRETEAD